MSPSLCPVEEVSRETVEAFLRSHGLSSAEVAWKYYDSRFNRGRTRGWVLTEDDRLVAFTGLIPFRVARTGAEENASWLCDILGSPSFATAYLLRRIVRSGDELKLGFRGNDQSRPVLRHLAVREFPGAVVRLRRSLRVADVLGRAKLGSGVTGSRPWKWLGAMPVPSFRVGRVASRLERQVTSEPGLAPAIAPLVEERRRPSEPFYDFEYVDWQVGRCPILRSRTFWMSSEPAVPAAALIWCLDADDRSWKVALWSREGADAELAAVLSAAVSFLLSVGALSVSAIAARTDLGQISLLRRYGFWPQRATARPVFALDPAGGEVDEPSRLSYLDADAAYRFGGGAGGWPQPAGGISGERESPRRANH